MDVNLDLLKTSNISDTSYKNYLVRIRRIEEVTGHDIKWAMFHPLDTIKSIKSKISTQPSTIANYTTVICKLYSLHPRLINVNKKHYDAWQKYLKHYKEQEQERYKETEYNPKQESKRVPWKELEATFCKLKTTEQVKTDRKLNQDFLLFAMFLNLFPKRADFGCLRVYKTQPRDKDKGNYVYISPKPYLVLNTYKTSKNRGAIVEPIPFELLIIIKESMRLFPRDYLIVQSDGKTPYDKNNSYGKHVQRVFKRHFGKDMGVSLWRSVYINANMNFQYDKYKDLEKGAHLSGHSIHQQFMAYRKGIISKDDVRPDNERYKPVKC